MPTLTLTRIALWIIVTIAVTDPANAELYPPDAASQSGQACAQMPVEPMEDADFEFADYGAGLIFREYDLDGDGHPDFMTARQIDAMSNRFPLRLPTAFKLRPYSIGSISIQTLDMIRSGSIGEGKESVMTSLSMRGLYKGERYCLSTPNLQRAESDAA